MLPHSLSSLSLSFSCPILLKYLSICPLATFWTPLAKRISYCVSPRLVTSYASNPFFHHVASHSVSIWLSSASRVISDDCEGTPSSASTFFDVSRRNRVHNDFTVI